MEEQDAAYEIDVKERFWDKYLTHCHAQGLVPSYKDFSVWYEEQG